MSSAPREDPEARRKLRRAQATQDANLAQLRADQQTRQRQDAAREEQHAEGLARLRADTEERERLEQARHKREQQRHG